MTKTEFTESATPRRDGNDQPGKTKDVVIVMGPSGAGKRTAIGILEDLFEYRALTKVTLEQLLPLVDVMPADRLVFHPLLSGRETPVLLDGYGAWLDQCLQCFHELQRRCRRFQILFLYCVQEELASRQTVGFHPFAGWCGTLKAAIFKECEMLVQLFCRLASDSTLGRHVGFIDTSGFSFSDLRAPVEEQMTPAGEPPVHPSPESFITRGWNQMRKTLYDVARQREKFLEDTRRPGRGDPSLGRLNCLLVGETGVGKELIAAHLAGGDSQMVRLNCEGMPRELLESELWGHVRGAFTHAVRDRQGLVSQANGKTLFVDEIGFADPVVQQKLLRFIETREYRKLGSDKPAAKVDCRIIAATSRDLEQDMRQRTFLPDLYYRIAGVTITVPPLRHRREDIPVLLDSFLKEDSCKRFSPEALAVLFDHRWGGNVRMLKNVVEQCRQPAGMIPAQDLPSHITRPYEGLREYHDRINVRFWRSRAERSTGMIPNERLTGTVPTGYDEEQDLRDALAANNWNITRAARHLKKHRSTVHRMMKEWGVQRPQKAGASS